MTDEIPVPPGHKVDEEPPASAAPINKDVPTITGTTAVGQTLTCTMGNWDNEPTGYQYLWRRNGLGASIPSEATYTLVEADLGAQISCLVVATNAFGSVGAMSNDVGPVTAGGSA